MKKLLPAVAALLCCALLCGCGNIFEKEYVSVTDYVPPAQNETELSERVTVRDFNELKAALKEMVYSGSSGGSIAFDANYQGNAPEDMESACWQVRTQDSLCAYCVRDMSFEMEKIVNYYECTVSIVYTSYAAEVSSIILLPYSVGIGDILRSAMEENRTRVTIQVNTSSYSADKVRTLALELYRANPTLCVREPKIVVYMYSGAGRQRLYEINFDYGMAEDEVIRCKSQLKNLDVMNNLSAYELDPVHRAFAACEYLTENCSYSEDFGSSCYDALILCEADSEGLALAYVEMCTQMDVDCRIVYGQLGGEDHCWNIIKIDGSYYHVDVSRCFGGDFASNFLCSDESIWSDYRWNINSYPACRGELNYSKVFVPAVTEFVPAEASAPQEGSEEDGGAQEQPADGSQDGGQQPEDPGAQGGEH